MQESLEGEMEDWPADLHEGFALYQAAMTILDQSGTPDAIAASRTLTNRAERKTQKGLRELALRRGL